MTALAGFAAVVGAAAGKGAGNDGSSAPESTGGTLEWLAASPPPAGNFPDGVPTVESEYPVLDQNQGAE